ncbi:MULTISPECIES: VC2046/SO_2500 family protein [Gammaproteobacteria]|uniref:VC2046/SO_2500 family protein n=1 Tax=Gammaproteobacteria TaxID=1236 RepID=UPI000DCFE125|nr:MULTISPECIES: VC2046/SO_2500 family protein [Gammaproteobacteria]RTE87010.1 hypothetical protein DQX04_01060 [Aliidiomarina sp. B3213]TCZ93200.1 hypothetical protein EYQ95_04240 [Lysobacter sp. N42]
MVEQTVWIQREQDIDSKLIQSLHQNHTAQFKFLLASLSPHAPDWFDDKPKKEQDSWVPPFSIGVSRPMYASRRDHEREPAKFASKSMRDWLLLDALDPEAMVLLDEHDRVPARIRDNAPHWIEARSQERQPQEEHPQDLVDILDTLHQNKIPQDKLTPDSLTM